MSSYRASMSQECDAFVSEKIPRKCTAAMQDATLHSRLKFHE
jgi:hypothetical protein